VGIGSAPIAIEEHEITALQSVVKSGLPSMPWPFLKVGQKLRVKCGPLADLEGILLQAKGSHRLIISISLLQRSVAVEVDRDWVTPIDSQDANSYSILWRPTKVSYGRHRSTEAIR